MSVEIARAGHSSRHISGNSTAQAEIGRCERYPKMDFSKFHRVLPAALRRMALSEAVNYTHSLSISNKTYKIPIVGGIGEGLLKVIPDFKADLLRIFSTTLPSCFIDVGANIGQTIIECFSQRDWDKYYAFEPDVLACAYLHALVKVNRIPVTILPWAVGSNASPHNLYAKGPLDASATMFPEGRPGLYKPEMSTWIASYPFDMFLDMAQIPYGVMIKIDVEGFEAEVLSGANKILSTLRPILLCEVLRAYRESEVCVTHARMLKLEAILKMHRFKIFTIDMENEIGGRIRAIREISNFPRGLWRDNPSGIDYIFIPDETILSNEHFIYLN
jgi:FkbM family methyltransferase